MMQGWLSARRFAHAGDIDIIRAEPPVPPSAEWAPDFFLWLGSWPGSLGSHATRAISARATPTQVVVLTGGTRGVTARVAKALARRGSVKLALLARSAPGGTALDEASAIPR